MKKYISPHEKKLRQKIKELSLEGKLRRMFELLDTVEESDEGRKFKPLQISSVRVFMTMEMEEIFKQLKGDIRYKTPEWKTKLLRHM